MNDLSITVDSMDRWFHISFYTSNNIDIRQICSSKRLLAKMQMPLVRKCPGSSWHRPSILKMKEYRGYQTVKVSGHMPVLNVFLLPLLGTAGPDSYQVALSINLRREPLAFGFILAFGVHTKGHRCVPVHRHLLHTTWRMLSLQEVLRLRPGLSTV